MARRCPACGTTAADDLAQCPHCHAWIAALPTEDEADDPLDYVAPGAVGLELDVPAPAAASADPFDQVLGVANGGALPVPDLDVPAVPQRKARDVQEPDPIEVRAAADYGAAPPGLFASIPYVLHVGQRWLELRTLHRDAKGRRVASSAVADRALAALGHMLYERSAELGLEVLAAPLEAVRRTATVAGQRAQAASQAEQAAQGRFAEIDRRLAEVQAEANPFRDRETKLVAQLKVRESDLARARARAQRAEIELRNLSTAAETSGTAVDESRKAALEAEIAARRAEAERAEAQVKEVSTELGPVRRELATRLGRVSAIEDEKRRAGAASEREVGLHTSASDEAQKALEEAQRGLAEAALERGLATDVGSEAKQAAEAVRSRDARAREEKLYAMALDAWDRPAVKRGAGLLGAATLLVVVALVLLIVR